MRATLLSAALALVVSPFVQPAIARADFNPDFYSFCIKNLGQGNDYCCAHAGGVVKGGGCVDPVYRERLLVRGNAGLMPSPFSDR